jgi:putative CocE/NonD family hydrolase
MRTRLILAVFASWIAPAFTGAQGLEAVVANYTKSEYRVPMRDGVHLFTAVYTPKDTTKTYPFMMMRTPYSIAPYGVDRSKADLGPSPEFGRSGYIFVYQDVRGRWMSEGTFENMRPILKAGAPVGPKDIDESTDTFDTIEWLLKNVPGHNGRVGQWGISYPGFYTACALVNHHPALVAASPQAPVTDWFIGDDFHHHGALFLPHLFNFIGNFGRPRPGPISKLNQVPFDHGTPDGYKFFLELPTLADADPKHFKGQIAFWNELLAHPNYDAFWQDRNLRAHLKNVKPGVAVLTVGGWFDAENLFGALETYKTIEASSPGVSNRLVMGPWSHGGWSRGDGASLGPVSFGSNTGAYFRDQIEFPFFEKALKQGQEADLADAIVFETGRNQWRHFDAWPPRPARADALYLHADGALAFEPPDQEAENAFDEYVSDPARPVPFLDDITIGMTSDYMVQDQRHASRRPDVLVYQTPPLEEDRTVVGPLKAELIVSTTGTDSDWIVKLIDVYPDDYPDPEPNPTGTRRGGYQQLVRGEVMRGRFRDSHETPAAFEPGVPTKVTFAMQDVCHTFRPGHRMMVQIQSTWFPLVDRNPQTYVNINTAKASDFQKATQRVYRSKERASRISLMVLPPERPGPVASSP